jgi:hypothetical protein
MTRIRRSALPGLVALVACLPAVALAQGDGPRVYSLGPVGFNVLSLTYMGMDANYNFQQTVLLGNADINSDVVALSYLRLFRVGGRFANIWVTPIWGRVDGSLTPPPTPGGPAVINAPTVSGFADPYVAFRIGLVGAPGLPLAEFVKHKPGFQLYALAGANIPIGDYEGTRPLNLGTNRWAFRFGVPMVQPFLSPKRPLVLEVVPSLYVFGDNNDPYGGGSVRSQDPLLAIETHLSYNLSPKIWVGGDLRYQNGGETSTDGVPDDNHISHLGGNLNVGYQVAPPLMVFAGYGGILTESDGSKGTMFRIRANLIF